MSLMNIDIKDKEVKLDMPKRRVGTSKILHPLLMSLINKGQEKNKGSSVVLYGNPGEGKSTFVANLCRQFIEMTNRKALYIAIDENLNTDFGEKLKVIANAEWIFLDYPHPRTLVNFISRLRNPQQYVIIVVDSITGLFETLAEEFGDPADPRINLYLIRYSSVITKKLAKLSHEHNMVTILIAHLGSIYTDEWLGLKEKPAFSLRAVKNVDVVLKAITKKIKDNKKEDVLERHIKVMYYRSKPEFNMREFNVKELLGGDIRLP